MPGYDRTGPMGEGSMSGWGQGLCGSNQAAQTPAGYGRMGGRGRGGYGLRGRMRGGFGRRPGMRPFEASSEAAGDDLRSVVEELRRSLTAIEQQLGQINQKDE